MLRVILALALVATVAAGGCPNKCSGHGSCVLGDKCECQPLFVGTDCSGRECAFGLSWITAADTDDAPAGTLGSGEGLGGRHLYAECSDKGVCDRSTGECQCYEGYEGKGCRRQKCPNDCAGHGRCVYNTQVNANYSPQGYAVNDNGADLVPNHFIEFTSQYWDYQKTRSCVCDRGFEGIDCSDRTCAKGDDPLTDCTGSVHTYDTQRVIFAGAYFTIDDATGIDADTLSPGFFTFSFTDMYGANYTTRPIELPYDEFTTTGGALLPVDAQRYADDMEDALESLPNFAIPNVTVAAHCTTAGAGTASTSLGSDCASGNDIYIDVAFVDAANAGPQNLLQCSYASESTASAADSGSTDAASVTDAAAVGPYNYGASQPRFVAPYLGSTTRVCTVAHVGEATMEHVECSNRGQCDSSSGLCECYEGFTGEACATQTVFF